VFRGGGSQTHRERRKREETDLAVWTLMAHEKRIVWELERSDNYPKKCQVNACMRNATQKMGKEERELTKI
jgi:hypothetical protein